MPDPHFLRKLTSIVVGDGEPLPTEFLIFSRGANDSLQGVVHFTERSAQLVMAQYVEHGVDVAMDLEHSSLDGEVVVARADATDAMCWFKLEVREGDLWATDVRWTAEGERRLRNKLQRYTSPAFYANDEGEVVGFINVALCSRPATLQNAALVAATARTIQTEGSTMNADQLKAVISAIKEENGETALKLLEDMLATAVGAEGETPVEGEALAESPEEPAPPKEPEAEEMAMATALRTCTGRASAGEAIAELHAMRKRCDDLDAEKAKLEDNQRKELVGELVKCGAEIPATAWEGDPEDRVPVARLCSEPVAELSARVAKLRKARETAPAKRNVAPPTKGADSAEDLAAAKRIKDPEKRARFLETRRARNERAGQ